MVGVLSVLRYDHYAGSRWDLRLSHLRLPLQCHYWMSLLLFFQRASAELQKIRCLLPRNTPRPQTDIRPYSNIGLIIAFTYK